MGTFFSGYFYVMGKNAAEMKHQTLRRDSHGPEAVFPQREQKAARPQAEKHAGAFFVPPDSP